MGLAKRIRRDRQLKKQRVQNGSSEFPGMTNRELRSWQKAGCATKHSAYYPTP